MKRRFVLSIMASALAFYVTPAFAIKETGKESLITDAARNLTARGSAAPSVLGNASNFQSPCVALPADRTPDDGNPNNDGGWQLVNFCTAGATGNRPAQSPDCHHNDDDSASLALPFTFTLYGTNFNSTYINNNGNLSFGQLFSTFTAAGFPVSGFPMVAPFWADVDSDDLNGSLGHVWFKLIGSNTLGVTWDNVGYFILHGDKLNTFQVLISNGTNSDMGLANNICFCYDDMQWTTGDASGGVGGLGGTAATVGTNSGDGITYSQIGRFDQAGVSYDGPYGNNDGVDYLDNRGTGTTPPYCFSASPCTVNSQCDDGNPCSADACSNSICVHAPIPYCGIPPVPALGARGVLLWLGLAGLGAWLVRRSASRTP